ncbi:hypothetical protein EJB05_13375 [Eragrostis curvula]|uniref:Glycosyltransferase n=1 Tax=Eragrostis curvula TaxID=38414 RepID=A0A5J9VWB7_9POAL|nr:hypothetical protein EJB05_13375 [Eragrostis curvula]
MAAVQEARTGDVGSRVPQTRPARRVLVFPLPFQGHINPMMQLADVLHGRGLAVTVLHTHFNALDPALHPAFDFVSVADGIPADVAASKSGNIIDIILAMNEAMEASTAVDEVLASVMADEARPRPACLFLDGNLLAVQKAAVRLGLPTLVLRTGCAACLGGFLAFPMFYQKGYLPRQVSQLYMPVKELPPLRVRDIFFSVDNNHEKVRTIIARIIETVKGSSGVVINTFEALEAKELERIRRELDLPLVLAAGPLHKLSSTTTGSSLLDQDYSCIKWLDSQPARSVLYVSFGSLASLSSNEFLEVAWGLANSGHNFLWVVRPGMIRGMNGIHLPNGFDVAVEGRGKVIQWAPQQEVLAHQAVGAFWTHNGWNSTLESISEGIPMICRPHSLDQTMNARYVAEIWGVGFELEGELERRKIELAIRNLMSGKEGAEMRERAEDLKMKVVECLESSGSSHIAIDKLVNYILSL